ncbi:hypothetical protein ABW636_09820 [Aquimarina sp. 2201CG1-2-11]|uniref:hypothetical protein n=1 Tax=Aquimarina discodermiae TaxID=3231043 RepID=UPI003461AAA9
MKNYKFDKHWYLGFLSIVGFYKLPEVINYFQGQDFGKTIGYRKEPLFKTKVRYDLWDRIFDTHQSEEDKVVYGLTKNINPYDFA